MAFIGQIDGAGGSRRARGCTWGAWAGRRGRLLALFSFPVASIEPNEGHYLSTTALPCCRAAGDCSLPLCKAELTRQWRPISSKGQTEQNFGSQIKDHWGTFTTCLQCIPPS